MNRTDRAVQALGLTVARPIRARFVEEWQADIAAGRALGLSEREILLAAGRVAIFLLWVRGRSLLLRPRGRFELLVTGVLLGLLLVVVDVPLQAGAAFVVCACAWWGWKRLTAWIRGGA